eukprot:gene1787-4897_t
MQEGTGKSGSVLVVALFVIGHASSSAPRDAPASSFARIAAWENSTDGMGEIPETGRHVSNQWTSEITSVRIVKDIHQDVACIMVVQITTTDFSCLICQTNALTMKNCEHSYELISMKLCLSFKTLKDGGYCPHKLHGPKDDILNTLVIQGTKYMAIFGGTDSNAVWLFDFGSHQFKHTIKETIDPDGPVPRILHASANSEDRLFVAGGCILPSHLDAEFNHCTSETCHYGIDILSDVWMWTFNDGWTAILIEGLQLPRFSGLAFYYENQLHFIGGYPSYKSYLFDIDVDFTHYVLDVTCSNIESHRPLKWQLLITNETASPMLEFFDPELSSISVKPSKLRNTTELKDILPPRLGFSSVVAVNTDEFVIIAGQTSNLNAPSNKAFRFNGKNTSWELLDSNRFDADIPRRMGHCSIATTEDSIITFGGQAPLAFFNDITIFELRSESWSRIPVDTHPPQATYAAGIVYNNSFILHGGLRLTKTAASANFFMFDFAKKRWEIIWTPNRPPIRRYGHSVNVVGNTLYYFGGAIALSSNPDAIQNSLFTVDMNTWFLNITVFEDTVVPQPRMMHSAQYDITTECIYVFGGCDHFDTFDDFWRFDIASYQWHKIGSASNGATWPGSRSSHVSFILDHQLYIYGGSNRIDMTVNALADVWRFDIASNSWKKIIDTAPAGHRFSSTSVTLPGKKKVIISLGAERIGNGLFRSDVWEVYHVWTDDDLLLAWNMLNVTGQISRYAHVAGFHRTLHVFSGRSSTFDELKDSSMDLMDTTINLGCNPGTTSSNFLMKPCEPCPRGYYAYQSGANCSTCPGVSFTKSVGTTSRAHCTECQSGACSGNGRCSINSIDFSASCHCNFGYTGPECSVNFLAITLGTTLAAIVITSSIYYVIRVLRKSAKEAQSQSELHEKLLAESQIELSLMERAWEIDFRDLTLLECIGQGTFGEVYRGIWNESMVAVKKLRSAIALLNPDFLDEFQAEVRLQRTLRHRNVVLFFGAGVFPDETPFLVTEYLRKGSLEQVLASVWPKNVDCNNEAVFNAINPDNSLPWALRVKFARDAARGMNFLHGQSPPRLHRDIKSANMLVSEKWTVKVADFSALTIWCDHYLGLHLKSSSFAYVLFLRLSMSDNRQMTQAVGTLSWCAPEVMGGHHYGLPCDVYSFGILMWEIETCRLPYAEVNRARTIPSLVLQGIRPSLLDVHHFPRKYAQDYRQIITQCWQGEADSRPTFPEILEQLENIHNLLSKDDTDSDERIDKSDN